MSTSQRRCIKVGSFRSYTCRYLRGVTIPVFTASLSTLDTCPSSPSQPLAQDTCERITLLPAFPFYLLSFSFLSCFGHDHQHLAAAPRHQYALNMVLTLFLSILLTLFLTFSCSSGATTTQRRPVYPLLNNTAHSSPPVSILSRDDSKCI